MILFTKNNLNLPEFLVAAGRRVCSPVEVWRLSPPVVSGPNVLSSVWKILHCAYTGVAREDYSCWRFRGQAQTWYQNKQVIYSDGIYTDSVAANIQTSTVWAKFWNTSEGLSSMYNNLRQLSTYVCIWALITLYATKQSGTLINTRTCDCNLYCQTFENILYTSYKVSDTSVIANLK